MTIDEFRRTSPYVIRMRELLADPVMQDGLLALLDSNRPRQLADNAEAVASIRQQSQARGFDDAIAKLLLLCEPIQPPPREEETTYEPET